MGENLTFTPSACISCRLSCAVVAVCTEIFAPLEIVRAFYFLGFPAAGRHGKRGRACQHSGENLLLSLFYNPSFLCCSSIYILP